MATFSNGESGSSVRAKLNEIIEKVEGTSLVGNDIKFGDNDKATFGAGPDLQIFHNGSNSYIRDTGTGNLIIDGTNLQLRGYTTSESFLEAIENGAVTLFYNNGARLSTTSTGVDVTGTVTADGLTVDGNVGVGITPSAWRSSTDAIQFGKSASISSNNNANTVSFTSNAYINSSNANIRISTGKATQYYQFDGEHVWQTSGSDAAGTTVSYTDVLRIANNGDISFYEDTGTTPKFFWDASTERLGIGNAAPATALDVTGTVTADGLTVDGSGNLTKTTVAGEAIPLVVQNQDSSTSTAVSIGFANTSAADQTSSLTKIGAVRVNTPFAGDTDVFINTQTNGGSLRRALFSTAGDISFYEDTGTTPKFFWDASAESLGIGTSSPAKSIETRGGVRIAESTGAVLDITPSSTGTNGVEIKSTYYADGYGPLIFNTGNAERMRITSTGNVGIGTSSPRSDTGTTTLEVSGSTTARLLIQSTNTGGREYGWYASVDGQFGLYDYTASAERMRIDASGSLLVGRTSSSGVDTDGHVLWGSGISYQSATSNSAQFINRNGTDGAITTFYKSGSPVGSIGTASGRIVVDSKLDGRLARDGVDCLQWGDNRLIPSVDNYYNLGDDVAGRFKDLYLSGGVYLGGTGAANKLDDYETGTFTATLKGSTGEPATLITANYAKYTKVGDTVFIEISYENVNTTGYSGDISIDTLPFTSGTGRSVLNVAHYQTSSWGTTDIPIALIGGSTTTVSFLNYSSGTTWQTTTHSAGSGRYLWITGTYKV